MKPAGLEKRKSLLRNQLRQRLRKLSASQRKRKSRKIAFKLLRAAEFKKARHVLIYASLPSEVETWFLIRKALLTKKSVCLPRIDSRQKKIEAYQVKNLKQDLKKGAFGIWEPKRVKRNRLSPGRFDLVVVPGVGFDRKGGRLGRGGGFFDRFLKKTDSAFKIAVAFREQMVKKIPRGAHDVRVDRVLTD